MVDNTNPYIDNSYVPYSQTQAQQQPATNPYITNDYTPYQQMLNNLNSNNPSNTVSNSPVANVVKSAYHLGKEVVNNPQLAANNAAIGFYTNVDSYQSTLQKAVGKALQALGLPNSFKLPISSTLANPLTASTGAAVGLATNSLNPTINYRTPQEAQNEFNQDVNQEKQASQQTPAATSLGGTLGQIGATLPAVTVNPELGYIGNAAAQGALWGVAGTVQNQPGQDPNQILNPANGATQGLFAAMLSPAATYIQKLGAKTTQLQNAQQSLAKTSGYTGNVVSSDLPAQDLIDKGVSWVVNNTLNKFGSFGMNPTRDAQQQALQSTLANYTKMLSGAIPDGVSNYTELNKQAALSKLSNSFSNVQNQINQKENQLWQTALAPLPDVIPTNNSTPLLKNILADPNSGLSNKDIQNLTSNIGPQSPQSLLNAKSDVWKMYSRLQGKVSANTATANEADTAQNLLNYHWSLLDDIKSALPNDPDVLNNYNKASQFTKTNAQLMDPSGGNAIAKAALQGKQFGEDIRDFAKWALNPSATSQQVTSSQMMAGSQGSQALAGMGIGDALSNSMENDAIGNPVLNVSKFLGTIKQMPNSTQAPIYQPALDALSGLEKMIMNPVAKNQAMQQGAAKIAGQPTWEGALIGLGKTGAAVPAYVLSKIATYSPLKTTLIAINKATNNPELSQVLINKAAQLFTKGNIALHSNNTLVGSPSPNQASPNQ